MTDARSRYERWTKEQLLEEVVKFHRGRSEDQLHRAAIKRDLARAEALQNVSIKELDAWLGGPIIRDLILAIHDTKEAGDPRSSPPMENTMRVSHPDSSRDEGASTRRYRKMKGSVRYHLEKCTDTIRNNLERDPDEVDKHRRSAILSHHSRGLHAEKPNDDCDWCQKEAV